ncbi:unnamed protein product [Prorocentrum cordatum]|uniref:Uncharacterized protein n=1 Tax=Prorocentrum cordatum TaxID=2364126 RepID=A0ABN9UBU9_9DINO|nr:unnamed protein product [Polarella glacialis]
MHVLTLTLVICYHILFAFMVCAVYVVLLLLSIYLFILGSAAMKVVVESAFHLSNLLPRVSLQVISRVWAKRPSPTVLQRLGVFVFRGQAWSAETVCPSRRLECALSPRTSLTRPLQIRNHLGRRRRHNQIYPQRLGGLEAEGVILPAPALDPRRPSGLAVC